MSIQALPQSTVRVLGAGQALTDPSSLVKELLDNALDANANSVAISISSNTLDVIQVRDNGHGIAPQDRPLVARRYCTSKICDDGDLKNIGGSSLGFRGEALASAAELSGTLTISTRTEIEQVGTSLNISQQGELIGQERASLAVGTTVKIIDFIKANPVRRQVALKNADACLRKIKRLLQAYAFARPHCRLSLNVLKAKNKKGDWVYAPKPGGNAEDAAFKIVGAACASSCLWSVVDEQGLSIQAFLPRPDADVSKVSNIGSFLSIDARPVSTSRGLLKQITKVFRESLKTADSKFDGVKEPFIFMEISGGSYDANLEPAKDDVLFENADTVLEVVRSLLAAVYKPMVPTAVPADEPAALPTSKTVPQEDDHEFESLEQQLPTNPFHDAAGSASLHANATEEWVESLNSLQRSPKLSTPVPAIGPATRSNMYGFDAEDLGIYEDRPPTGRTETDFAELRQARNDVTLSNPWVFAKMNTSTKGPSLEEARHSRSPARHHPLAANVIRGSSPTKYYHNVCGSGLPTPRPSSPSPPTEGYPRPNHDSALRTVRDSRLIGPSDLPPPQVYTPASSILPRNLEIDSTGREDRAGSLNYPNVLERTPQEPTTGTRLSDIPDASSRPRRTPMSRVNKPFVPPSNDNTPREQVWFDTPANVGNSKTRRARQGQTNSLVAQGELGAFEEEMRPLTPPTRNRDIRDFTVSGAGHSVSSMIEKRNFGRAHQQPVSTSDEVSRIMPEEGIRPVEAVRPNRGFMRASELVASDAETLLDEALRQSRGFMPVSEVVALDAENRAVEKQPPRISKRRKTTDRIPLQELSTNAPVESIGAEDEAEYRPPTSKRAQSRRRSSRGLNRTKSSRLPLERISDGHATNKLIFNVSTDIEQLRQLADNIDQGNSLLSYNEPAVYADEEFAPTDALDLHALTSTLHRLLIAAGSDTDVVDPADLFQEVHAAYAQHAAENTVDEDSDMLMSSA